MTREQEELNVVRMMPYQVWLAQRDHQYHTKPELAKGRIFITILSPILGKIVNLKLYCDRNFNVGIADLDKNTYHDLPYFNNFVSSIEAIYQNAQPKST